MAKSKSVVAGNDLSLEPVKASVGELNDSAGKLEGYTTTVVIPVPLNLQATCVAGAIEVSTQPKGKRALKMGPDKLKRKALKAAERVAKEQKQFWAYRYQELKAQANAGKPPRKARTPKTDAEKMQAALGKV